MQTNNQYEMLKRCSRKKDLSEWNDWRKENPEKDINLNGYNFEDFFLKGANFLKGNVYNKLTDKYIEYTGEVHLEKAIFKSADLENIIFAGAILRRAVFHYAEANKADFSGADLEDADLSVTNLQDCRFSEAILKNARITSSHLEGTNFINATFIGCQVRASICDNATNFWKIKVNEFSIEDKFTDFSGTPIGNTRIDAGTRQLLEYNIRRMGWEDWYKENSRLKYIVRPFWCASNYGFSTTEVIRSFVKWALIFAVIYYFWGAIDYYLLDVKVHPGIVSNLFVLENNPENVIPKLIGDGLIEQQQIELKPVSAWLVPIRALYFSIVTMTTLGFGDMYANAHSFLRGLFGHTLLGFQVIIGYILLGALVTRLNILFTAGGPAEKFSE